MRIAFAGNPNSGKTTMFNALTGQNERVGNWAGVTVDKKEALIKKTFTEGQEVVAVDLPGTYSISPFTSEEAVTGDYIKTENPQVIVNIVDATNLSRSLFFTTQLLELGIPLVVALNKSDINEKKKTVIDTQALSRELGCPVVETISAGGNQTGLDEVVKRAIESVGKEQTAPFRPEGEPADKKSAVLADRKRYAYVNKLVSRVEKRKIRTNQRNRQDAFDEVITNKWVGLPIFALVMFLVFQISQAWVGPLIGDALTLGIDTFKEWVGGMLTNANPLLVALLVDGVIGGVGAVIGFLPLVMVMYFLIALLEDCGYMARAAVVLDPIFKKVGLSGKSVIPFVIGTGCAVPGVMACRTIRNDRERRATAMLTPFMPCGAKLPVIALFAGAFFGNASWVGTLMYFAGIFIIFFGALLVNWVTGNSRKKSYFILELPEYKRPSFWGACKSMLARGWSYIVKAGTVILLCNTVIHIMQTFNWNFTPAAAAGESILASVARPAAYLLVPVVGVLSWQMAAAALTGFIAKENVVGTLAVCFVGLENLIDAEELSLMEGAGAQAAGVFAITKVAALAYLMFNLFSPPCFAAIGAMNAEMKSAKWLWAGVGLQLAVGYTIGYFVYTVGTLITAPATLNVSAALGGLAAVLVMAAFVTVIGLRNRKKD